MSDLDDSDLDAVLRETMRSHGVSAPTSLDLLSRLDTSHLADAPIELGPAPLTARHRRWLPIVAAACVVLLLAGLVAAYGIHRRDVRAAAANRPLDCPASGGDLTPTVPHKPKGVNGTDRLVPDTTPTTAVICSWTGSNVGGGFTFAGRRVLTGSLAGITEQLRWAPQHQVGVEIMYSGVGGRQTDYLIGLTYPRGTIWIATTTDPNGETGTTNGRYASDYSFGPTAENSFKNGRWSPTTTDSRSTGHCGLPYVGRYGQEKQMVPDLPVSLSICRSDDNKKDLGQVTLGPGSKLSKIVAALNEPRPRPSQNSCNYVAAGERLGDVSYKIAVRYRSGPGVFIDVWPGCTPSVFSLSLATDGGSMVIPLLDAVLPR